MYGGVPSPLPSLPFRPTPVIRSVRPRADALVELHECIDLQLTARLVEALDQPRPVMWTVAKQKVQVTLKKDMKGSWRSHDLLWTTRVVEDAAFVTDAAFGATTFLTPLPARSLYPRLYEGAVAR